MRSIAGLWLGLSTVFAGMAWDAEWHAAGNTHAGSVAPPHLLMLVGIAIVTAAAVRGYRRADGQERGRVQTYLGAVALGGGLGVLGRVGDELLHVLEGPGGLVAIAHLAADVGVLVAAVGGVVATVAAVRSSGAESAA